MMSWSTDIDLQAIVFDFDGTLVTSPYPDFSEMHRRAREALQAFTPVPQKLEGPVLEDIERICSGLDEKTASAARNAALLAIEEVEVHTARQCVIFPFVGPMLRALKKQNIKAAIITRNCPAAVFTAFPDAGEHFECILTRNDVARVKPHPEHLLRALGVLGCEAGRSLMVGDHPMDIITGKRAGAFTAGVASGGSPSERLAEEAPDFITGDAGELMKRLGVMP